MERFLLFIRERGRKDTTFIRPSEERARKSLAAYVRRRLHQLNEAMPLTDDEAIRSYFAKAGSVYAITQIRPKRRVGER